MLNPKEADKGPGPVVGLQPVAVHRRLCIYLYCKLGTRRDQPGYEYEPVLGLSEPAGVTRVYKGVTWQRFKDDRQQLET